MTNELQQQLRQLEFERDYAEAQVGKLFVQNQHLQQTLDRTMARFNAICEQHGIDPQSGEKKAEA
jgi:hypothetical protein